MPTLPLKFTPYNLSQVAEICEQVGRTGALVPHIQTRLLARYLRGDHDTYPAFIWK